MHPMLTIAIRAARNAGDIILRASEHVSHIQIDNKEQHDFVTEIDRQAEREIISVIKTAYPDHAILAEESGQHEGNEYTWIIDPLDGTTNFLHGFPHYAVSIALKHKSRLEVGVIYLPLTNELFTAARGEGAMLNNRRIRVAKQASLAGSLIGTGFPFKAQQQKYLDAYLDMFKAVCTNTSGIRRTGSAAIDLAFLAMGRLDGFWEVDLKPWDIAAGIIIVKEAGGVVTDLSFNDQYLESGNIISANPKMHQLLYQLLEPHVTDNLK
ncbi:MAG: inositol monophosphatase [Methyloprofundus sp.]|nr:inositol monophosphatase [Methyloprofundus sp.]